MRAAKRYTNQTFTKRVDHEGGAHREALNLPEPAVCSRCGIVRTGRRWVPEESLDTDRRSRLGIAEQVICPACLQVERGIAGGYLSVEGEFFEKHRADIENLIRNEELREREDNPLSRTMNLSRKHGLLTLETTTEQLAQRLGKALQSAYDGELRYTFSHENKVLRVSWNRH